MSVAVIVPEAEADAARLIAEVLEHDGLALVTLARYRVGDQYETECMASALTVSREHTPGLHREGPLMRGVTHFPPAMLPERYRDKVSETGVVAIAIEFKLADVAAVGVFDHTPRWREQV